MSTAPIFSSQPSIWRLGMVDWRFNFGVYAAIVVGQFLINSTVGVIMYATSDDLSGHVDQSALNAAFMTGIYIFVAAIITTTTQLRAVFLSGASRSTLALSTYVHSGVVIAIASVIWWVLALTQTHIFFLGSLGYPLGVDSWLIVVIAWIACDGAGRLIGAASRHGRSPWTVALGIIVAVILGVAGIAAPVTWLVLTLVHKSGYLPPMHSGFWFLGLVTLAVAAAGWRLTLTGRLRRLG